MSDFNIKDLLITAASQPMVETRKVQQILSRAPGKQDFFRVKDVGDDLNFACIVHDAQKKHYLVKPSLIPTLHKEVVIKTFYICCDQDSNIYVWPVKAPDKDGRIDTWNASAHRVATHAKTNWVRKTSNMQLGEYEILEAIGLTKDPIWPDMEMSEIIEKAFNNSIIDSEDHELVKKLRGQI